MRKLFVTRDEVARYVFLTNAKNDGDRSAAVYRATGRKGSLPGAYWVTVTEASDSLDQQDIKAIIVRRYDAPLPASTAKAVHDLWLAMIEPTRVEKDVVCTSPTGIFGATNASGAHVEAVTVWLGGNCPCDALMDVGDRLIQYPRSLKQTALAREIENASYKLLKCVTR